MIGKTPLALVLVTVAATSWFFVGRWSAPDPDHRAECLYAALETLPAASLRLEPGDEVYPYVRACDGLTRADKDAIGRLMDDAMVAMVVANG